MYVVKVAIAPCEARVDAAAREAGDRLLREERAAHGSDREEDAPRDEQPDHDPRRRRPDLPRLGAGERARGAGERLDHQRTQ